MQTQGSVFDFTPPNFTVQRIAQKAAPPLTSIDGTHAATDGVTRKHLVAFRIVQHLEGTLHGVQAIRPLPQMR